MSVSKNILGKVFVALAWLAAAVLWLLSITMPETFGWFNLAWAAVIIAGSAGVAQICKGLIKKDGVVEKKFRIFFGAGLLLVAFAILPAAIVVPEEIVWPIIAIVVTAAILLSILAVGGKKWDQGSNQNVGYKDYRARKAEEEAKKNAGDKE